MIAEIATARSGRPVIEARPVRVPCVALMADGSGAQFERLAYADPAAQQVHTGIYDQSFIQGGLGRGRGFNRSAANPLKVWIYGNLPLPVPLASLARWTMAAPDRLARMVLRRRRHSNAADMTGLHPDLFPTEKAAAQARARFGDVEGRLRAIRLHARPELWSAVIWQPQGTGAAAAPERESRPPSTTAMRAEIEAYIRRFGDVEGRGDHRRPDQAGGHPRGLYIE